MNKKTSAQYEARALIIKAMAHPTRLMIIEELGKQERRVSDLTAMAGADTSTVSKHLLVLKNSGIVELEKRGQMVFYKLKCPCILKFISCIENVIQDRAKTQMMLIS